jgi:hypothetical protein
MRGSDAKSGSLFSYVDLDQRVPTKHPLRVIKALADDVLVSLDAEFERLYEGTGRQSIAPERLLGASLLQAFCSRVSRLRSAVEASLSERNSVSLIGQAQRVKAWRDANGGSDPPMLRQCITVGSSGGGPRQVLGCTCVR